MTRNERQREILQTLNGADPSFGSVETERGSIAGIESVTPAEDWRSVYSSASGPVHFGPGVYTFDSDFGLEPGKPVIGSPAPPGDDTQGTVFRATSGIADNRMLFLDSTGTMSESHFPELRNVTVDGNNNIPRGLDVDELVRHGRIEFVTFRNFNSSCVLNSDGRGTRFVRCFFEDSGTTNGQPATIVNGGRYWTFDNCEWVTCDAGLEIRAVNGGCRVVKSRFANHDSQFLKIDDGGSNDEASLTVSDCDFVDFSSAVNGLAVSADIPQLHITNNSFDGTDRGSGTANGNKAINVSAASVSRPFVLTGNTARAFTNTPVIDMGGLDADITNSANDPTAG